MEILIIAENEEYTLQINTQFHAFFIIILQSSANSSHKRIFKFLYLPWFIKYSMFFMSRVRIRILRVADIFVSAFSS
jgi:hypothetical protein